MAIARSDLALRANSLLAVEGGEGEQGKERKKERKKRKKGETALRGTRLCLGALGFFDFVVWCAVSSEYMQHMRGWVGDEWRARDGRGGAVMHTAFAAGEPSDMHGMRWRGRGAGRLRL